MMPITLTGKRIRERRHAMEMTQEDLGKLVGVSKATINKYETGIVNNFTRPRIEKLADVLDCSPGWLLGWDDLDTQGQEAALNKLKVFNTVKHNNGMVGLNTGTVNAGVTLTEEETELLRIYRALSIKDRIQLLSTAYSLEENKKPTEEG